MKLKLTLLILILLGSFSSDIAFAQSVGQKTIVDPKNPNGLKALSGSDFDQSVLVITDLTTLKGKSLAKPYHVTIELVNFHPTKKLLPVYTIGGIAYNDDGKHHDRIAGDGIFTSIYPVRVAASSSALKRNYAKADSFKYTDQLTNYMQSKEGVTQKLGISITCKTRIITCPEEHWWDTCWPLSSPCQCVDFYDCEVEIDISIF